MIKTLVSGLQDGGGGKEVGEETNLCKSGNKKV